MAGGGSGGVGGGRLTDRWERCEVGGTGVSKLDKFLSAHIMCIHFLFLVRFLAVFLFPSLSRAIPYKLDIRVSVYIRPVLHKCPWFA